MKPLDQFYQKQSEPTKSCFDALRQLILSVDQDISNELKYGMPFFLYKGKMFCYLWFHKREQQPYIGLVEGKYFTETYFHQEKRSRMKIMFIDPNKDFPIKRIEVIIRKAISLYKDGKIKRK